MYVFRTRKQDCDKREELIFCFSPSTENMLHFLDSEGAVSGEDVMTHGLLIFFFFGFTTYIMPARCLDSCYIFSLGSTGIRLCRQTKIVMLMSLKTCQSLQQRHIWCEQQDTTCFYVLGQNLIVFFLKIGKGYRNKFDLFLCVFILSIDKGNRNQFKINLYSITEIQFMEIFSMEGAL